MSLPFWLAPQLPFTLFYPTMPPYLLAPNFSPLLPIIKQHPIITSDLSSPYETNNKDKSSKRFLVESILPSLAEKHESPPQTHPVQTIASPIKIMPRVTQATPNPTPQTVCLKLLALNLLRQLNCNSQVT